MSDLDQKNPSPKASVKSRLTSSAIVETLRKRHIGVPLLGLLTLAVAAYFVLAQSPATLTNASLEPDPLADERPPVANFTVNATNGSTFDLGQHKGKVILVSFWTSTCSTCILELPVFSELAKRYKSEGLEVLSINLDPADVGTRVATDVWSKGGFEFDAHLDPERAVAQIFAIETVPSGFVIDRQGRLAFNSYGANDWLAPESKRLIEDLLLEK